MIIEFYKVGLANPLVCPVIFNHSDKEFVLKSNELLENKPAANSVSLSQPLMNPGKFSRYGFIKCAPMQIQPMIAADPNTPAIAPFEFAHGKNIPNMNSPTASELTGTSTVNEACSTPPKNGAINANAIERRPNVRTE